MCCRVLRACKQPIKNLSSWDHKEIDHESRSDLWMVQLLVDMWDYSRSKVHSEKAGNLCMKNFYCDILCSTHITSKALLFVSITGQHHFLQTGFWCCCTSHRSPLDVSQAVHDIPPVSLMKPACSILMPLPAAVWSLCMIFLLPPFCLTVNWRFW